MVDGPIQTNRHTVVLAAELFHASRRPAQDVPVVVDVHVEVGTLKACAGFFPWGTIESQTIITRRGHSVVYRGMRRAGEEKPVVILSWHRKPRGKTITSVVYTQFAMSCRYVGFRYLTVVVAAQVLRASRVLADDSFESFDAAVMLGARV